MSHPAPISNRVGATKIPFALRGASALELFRLGYDTFDISAHFGTSEAEALKSISLARSAARGRPTPYPVLLSRSFA